MAILCSVSSFFTTFIQSLKKIMAVKQSWTIVHNCIFLGLVSIQNNFVSSQNSQYSAPILSPGSDSDYQNQNNKGPFRPGPGYPEQSLSQDSSHSGSSSFAGAGFPPSRLPGENYGRPHLHPITGNLPDYDVSGGDGVLGEHNHNIPGTYSKSKTVSGDYCWDPLFGCDTENTILYCIVNRCTCPTGWTLTPGSIPLNTVWDPKSNRCLSLLGSGCHVTPSYTPAGNGYVHCQPGVNCIPAPNSREVGTCGATGLGKHNIVAILVLCQIIFASLLSL